MPVAASNPTHRQQLPRANRCSAALSERPRDDLVDAGIACVGRDDQQFACPVATGHHGTNFGSYALAPVFRRFASEPFAWLAAAAGCQRYVLVTAPAEVYVTQAAPILACWRWQLPTAATIAPFAVFATSRDRVPEDHIFGHDCNHLLLRHARLIGTRWRRPTCNLYCSYPARRGRFNEWIY
jgi:hypothetical protein